MHKPLGMLQTPVNLPTAVAGSWGWWDRALLLLKPSDGKGADALHLSPSAHQKRCEETAQLRAKEHIC